MLISASPAASPESSTSVAQAGPQPPSGGESAAPPTAGFSLLELAAAQREQRRQEILAASPLPVVEPARVAEPAASPVAAPEDDEPTLGAFDADFTWSAEVLAAQGRRVEEV